MVAIAPMVHCAPQQLAAYRLAVAAIRQKVDSPSYVYFIHAPTTRKLKIGFASKDPEGRLASSRTGSPVPLELVAVVPGDRELEGALHRIFGKSHSHLEWFDVEPGVERLMRFAAIHTKRIGSNRMRRATQFLTESWTGKPQIVEPEPCKPRPVIEILADNLQLTTWVLADVLGLPVHAPEEEVLARTQRLYTRADSNWEYLSRLAL